MPEIRGTGMITLFEHNERAYKAALSMLESRGKAAVIHPTGTGKSFVGFKLCEEFPKKTICWLSPSEYIFNTQLENLTKTGAEQPNNVIFYTYAKLMNMSDDEIRVIEPDFVILDEFHRCGAKMWGEGVKRLLGMFPEAKVLGLTATSVRYLDNQRDMADELFDGNIASEMSLGEAIVRGILNPPKYVLSVYSYHEELKKYEYRIRRSGKRFCEAEKYIEALKRTLEKAEGIEKVFARHIEKGDGKYIVFCSNYEHLCRMKDKAKEWFSEIDENPHIYTVYSEIEKSVKEFELFKEDKSSHLKLLYCIDMLNEGIHVEDVSGVILLRPTVSPIVYKQQIGRALAAVRKDSIKSNDGSDAAPVIFDIVLNIENLSSIDAIEDEMESALTYYRLMHREEEIVNESFNISYEIKNCIKLFEKLNQSLSVPWDTMYEEAVKYRDKNGNLNVPKRFVTEGGLALGSWINTQRLVRSGKCYGRLTASQIDKLDRIGMRWERANDIIWEKYIQEARRYYMEHGDLLVPVAESDKEKTEEAEENKETERSRDNIAEAKYASAERSVNQQLGKWISRLRSYRKSGIKSSYLTEERIKELDAIGMVWDVPDYLWEKNYQAAAAYSREHGNLNVAASYVTKDGIKLGAWLANLKAAYNSKDQRKTQRAEITPEQYERLRAIGFEWENKHEKAWEKMYDAARRYKEKCQKENAFAGDSLNRNNNLHENEEFTIPLEYVTEDGLRLGLWLRRQKDNYASLSNVRASKLRELGINIPPETSRNVTEREAAERESSWEKRFALVKKYYDEHGNSNIPANYIENGIWVGRWVAEQKKKLRNMNIGQANAAGILPWQKAKLESVGISGDSSKFDSMWNSQYEEAKAFYETNINKNENAGKYNAATSLTVPKQYVTKSGKNLNLWLQNQRSSYRHGKLNAKQIQLLEDIGMVWNMSDAWTTGYNHAQEYYKKHGNLNVQNAYICADGYALGKWISNQRSAFKGSGRKMLSADQIAKLNALGMAWNAREKQS